MAEPPMYWGEHYIQHWRAEQPGDEGPQSPDQAHSQNEDQERSPLALAVQKRHAEE